MNNYLESIEEVRKWLQKATPPVDQFIYLLLDNGYDDLDAISRATDAELDELESLFPLPETRKAIRQLCTKLHEIGIAGYRNKGFGAGGSVLPPLPGGNRAAATSSASTTSLPPLPAPSALSPGFAAIPVPAATAPLPPPPPVHLVPAPAAVVAPAPVPALPPAPPAHSGFLSIKVNNDDWADRHCAWRDRECQLQWFKSRRDAAFEGFIDAKQVASISFPSDTTVQLKTAPPSNTKYEIASEGKEDMAAWMPVFDFMKACAAQPADQQLSRPSRISASSNASVSTRVPMPSVALPPPPPGFVGKPLGAPGHQSKPSIVPPPPPPGQPPAGVQSLPASTGAGPAAAAPVFTPLPPGGSRASTTMGSFAPSPPSGAMSPRSSTLHRQGSLDDKKERAYLQMLQEGAVFKKYHNKMGQKRCIWCPASLDRVLWGDEQKKEIKGFIKTSELQEVNKGHDNNKLRMYLVTIQRSLELEAPDASSHEQWMNAFKFLITKTIVMNQEMDSKKADVSFCTNIQSLDKSYSEVLRRGEVFRKYKKGGMQVRFLVFTPTLEKVTWSDLDNRAKPKGEILMSEIVEVLTHETCPSWSTYHAFLNEDASTRDKRLVVNAVGQYLTLEARDADTKQRWVDAITFYIKYGEKLPEYKHVYA